MEVAAMQNTNQSIQCTVDECQYHAKSQDYCTLDSINVVKHQNRATSQEETDCGSFKIDSMS